jgi:DNA helicase-2/ATP-dependent DNA helicase PcrA
MEEERRLCYVGLTRAQQRLYLVYAFRRTLYGRSELNAPSRFLRDIPNHLIAGRESFGARQGKLDMGAGAVRRMTTWTATSMPAVRQTTETEFHPGDKVHHPAFGKGTIINSHIRDGDEEVTVAFASRGIKKLVASLAKLTRVS